MCSFSGNVFCLISTVLHVDGSVAKISFSRLEDEQKINKKFRISSANKAYDVFQESLKGYLA